MDNETFAYFILKPLQYLLNSDSFIPHGHCYLWKPGLVSLHLFSDALIAFAYYSIPITLFYFVRRREDLPFDWIFLLFCAFIVACGTTHIMEVWTLWHPIYWLSGAIKGITAGVSLCTAMLLVPIVPKALALPSPAILEITNRELERQIAERHHIEEVLRKSEARYRAIVDDQTELIARFQLDGSLTFVNEAYCRYFGLKREKIIGNRYEPVIYEEDREKVAALVNSVSWENPVVMIENRVIVGNEIRWTQWINRALFDQKGNFFEFQSVGRDITSQKQAEAALQESQRFIQKIADTTPAILYVYDFLERKNVYINREFTELLGYTPEMIQLLGVNFSQSILHPEDLAQIPARQQRWQTVKDGDMLQTEYRMRDAKGEWRYLQCQETLFARSDDGLPRQILGAAMDITDRKLTQQLQTSLKEKEVLIKEIHHRVKNNLQIVYSLLRLQYRQTKDPQVMGILIESQNRIKSIALIHEKLYRSEDLAKINFAQYIPSLVSHLFSSYKIDSNTITLENSIEPIFLDIDRAIPCGMVVNELVSNALKYAFPHDYEGKININMYANDSSEITLIIKDNGIGIPPDFDLEQSESLGLQLVQDFIAQLEGTIELDRSQGITFRITFPGSNT